MRLSYKRSSSDKGSSIPKEEVDTATVIHRLRINKSRKLLTFVNYKSGGQVGPQIYQLFSKIIDSEFKASRQYPYLQEPKRKRVTTCKFLGKVFNINQYAPIDIFRDYKEFFDDESQDIRILVCGGDGTVTWILTAMQDAGIKRQVPLGILPLGTGNDLSIAFKWGGAFNNQVLQNEKIAYAFIEDIFKAKTTYLDSWSLVMKWPEDMDSQVDRSHFPKGSAVDDDRRIMFKQCFNYLSIGQDAHSCYNFDMVREQRPELFVHPNVNKLCYGIQTVHTGWLFGVSAVTSINRKIQILAHDIQEDKMVDITGKVDNNMLGIIILNLPNYAGGRDLWQINDKNKDKLAFNPQDPQDQLLEICGYRSSSDFALAALGIKPAIRLAQTKSIHINIRGINLKEQTKYPSTFLQVDGEPWKLPVPINNTRSTPKMYKSMLRMRERKIPEEDLNQITIDITYNRSFPMLTHSDPEAQKVAASCVPKSKRKAAKKRRTTTWHEATQQEIREEQQGEVEEQELGKVEEEVDVQQAQNFSKKEDLNENQPEVQLKDEQSVSQRKPQTSAFQDQAGYEGGESPSQGGGESAPQASEGPPIDGGATPQQVAQWLEGGKAGKVENGQNNKDDGKVQGNQIFDEPSKSTQFKAKGAQSGKTEFYSIKSSQLSEDGTQKQDSQQLQINN